MMQKPVEKRVQHGDHADSGAQMLGIGGRHPQGFGCGLEQDRIDRRLVLEGDLSDLGRQVKTTWKYGTGNNSA